MRGLARSLTLITVFFLSLCAKQALAQEQDESGAAPKPAARAIPVVPQTTDSQDSTSNDQDALLADSRPLTGIQTPTLGTEPFRHSYWVPGFQYGNSIQSLTPVGTAPIQGWTSDNYLAGNLSVLSTWSRAQLAVNYTGGGFLSTGQALGNGYFHELGMTQTFNWGRVNLSLLDQFSYLPEALFGFAGPIRLGVPGISTTLAPPSPDLLANLVPNQSILASTGTRYSNASAAELGYALNPRSSITMSGSYGFLNFLEAGNFDSAQTTGGLGYSFLLSSKDSIGVLYRFSGFQFQGASQAIRAHAASLAYGRKITGRLALQLVGGPEIAFFRVPVNGETSQVLPYASASLIYGASRGELSVGFTEGVSGGSGLLVGSSASQLSVGGNHRLGRLWTILGSLAYARNHSLATAPSAPYSDFGSWAVTTGLNYPIGPNATMSFGYTALIQTSSQPCVGACLTNFTQHRISIGFQWNTHPLVIR